LKKDSEYSTLTLDVRTVGCEACPVDDMLMPQQVMYMAFDHIYNLFIGVANVVVYVAIWFVPLGFLLIALTCFCAPRRKSMASQAA